MLTVKEIMHVEGYTLRAKVSNGVEGIFDIPPYIDKGIFTQLKNIHYLKQVKINLSGICWRNGQDFSVDTIEFDIKQ